MKSKIEGYLSSKYSAVAIYRSREIPEGAEPMNGHCVINGMLFPVASEGRTVYSSKKLNRCQGSVSGLGFGVEEDREWLKERFACGTEESPGNCYFKDPGISDIVLSQVNVYDVGDDYIVFEPLEKALSHDAPIQTVCFIVDPARMSALMTLAGFSRRESGPVIKMIHAFACEELYALPLAEGESDDPKAVVGLTELGIRRFCPPDVFSLTVPIKLYRRMEDDADESFLKGIWQRVLEKI